MIGGIKMYKKNQNWVTFNPNSAEYLFFAPFETIDYTVLWPQFPNGIMPDVPVPANFEMGKCPFARAHH